MIYENVSLFMLVVTSVALSVSGWQFLRAKRALHIISVRQIAIRNAIQKTRMDLREVGDRARLLETTVSGGTTAVEKLHKAISSTTFGLINMFVNDDEVRQSVSVVRKTHDYTSQQIYHSVRITNKALRILADTVIIGRAVKRTEPGKVVGKKLPPGSK